MANEDAAVVRETHMPLHGCASFNPTCLLPHFVSSLWGSLDLVTSGLCCNDGFFPRCHESAAREGLEWEYCAGDTVA
jgi:hypothetical protein